MSHLSGSLKAGATQGSRGNEGIPTCPWAGQEGQVQVGTFTRSVCFLLLGLCFMPASWGYTGSGSSGLGTGGPSANCSLARGCPASGELSESERSDTVSSDQSLLLTCRGAGGVEADVEDAEDLTVTGNHAFFCKTETEM